MAKGKDAGRIAMGGRITLTRKKGRKILSNASFGEYPQPIEALV
jgi:hypothetical protein